MELLELAAGAIEFKMEAKPGLLAITDEGIELKIEAKLELPEPVAEGATELKRDDKLELPEPEAEGAARLKIEDRLELAEPEELEGKEENKLFTRFVTSLSIVGNSCNACA